MANFDLLLVLPVVCLASYGLLLLLVEPWLRGAHRWYLGGVTLAGLFMSGYSLVRLWSIVSSAGPQETAYGLVRIDAFGLVFSFVLLGVTVLSVVVSVTFLEREHADQPEFYPLMLFCLAGMFLMLHTTHLLLVLVGLEVFSLALYVTTGLTRRRPRSIEAALKYFLLGAFSSGFLAYGMALLYGATGSLDLRRIGALASTKPTLLLWLGMGLVLVGLAFKIGSVPFHHWIPDVYQGAPTNVTGFMAAATKTATFAVLLRFLFGAFGGSGAVWIPLVTWLAILTMTVANLVALAQTDLKRLLAFSSIAHGGYLLVAVTCRPDDGIQAILFYLAVYGLTTIGAFAVLGAIGRGDAEGERGYTLDEWSGLGWRRPWLGAAMALFLLSLAGIPPTGGFFGKYVIFLSAVRAEQVPLAIVLAVNAAIAAYYYLRILVHMYMRPQAREAEAELPVPFTMAAVLLVAAAGILYLGLAPGRLLDVVQGLARSLL
jgi:NADH-quinone oxidoreductase subunit N